METVKIFRKAHREDLITYTREYNITTSYPEYKMHVHINPDEEESVRPN